jgi:glycerophosphoryl diester phosphodiesterase
MKLILNNLIFMAIIYLWDEWMEGSFMDERGSLKNRVKIQLHYFFSLMILVHCALYLVYWFAVGNLKDAVDLFIEDLTALQLPYITILMIITALIGLWSLVRFITFRIALRSRFWKPSFMNWVFFVVGLFFLALFYGSFVLVLRENPSQSGVIIHLLNVIRLVGDALLFLLAAIWLRRIILYLRRKMLKAKHQWVWAAGIFLSLLSLVGLWLIPTIFPPSWAYQGNLPPKPALLAHRGASMLAPENTLAAAELAAFHGAFGFETDVRISLDGVPILMHDETLERTTNIAEVFPERVNDRVSDFTLEELKNLNAGLWFIQKDPYGTIDAGLVSQTQLSLNQGQSIPTLSEALALIASEDMVILFDMRYPPKDHPYYDEFFEIVFSECQESGLNGNIWFLLDRDRLQIALDRAPQMTRVMGVSSTDLPSVERVTNLDYEIINVDTGIQTGDIRAYRTEGLGVNVYTIDEAWLFSQFWLSGVTSVTTNNVHRFSELDQPFINIPYSRYLLFWGLFGIIVAIWLASSQPEPEPTSQMPKEPPDLMDFATEEDESIEPIPTEWEPEVGEDEGMLNEIEIEQEFEPQVETEEGVKESQPESKVEPSPDGLPEERDEESRVADGDSAGLDELPQIEEEDDQQEDIEEAGPHPTSEGDQSQEDQDSPTNG